MSTIHDHNFPKFNELPPKEQQRLVRLFKQLDVTNDNKITAEDLAVAFKEMGIPYNPDGYNQSGHDSGTKRTESSLIQCNFSTIGVIKHDCNERLMES
ncbi:hypothetical protein CEXT_184611 [Caerostris extrusa]|uniref:EF-hand domain-containing protein n=1 Tax=Caerostris extrusa TaxID=172846 RepID=A0AAV4SM93_CAEEX|nr:hypothetical protein CEXT_184611 [Caerostris extrusa]